MGLLWDLFTGRVGTLTDAAADASRAVDAVTTPPRFAVDADAIDPAVFGLTAYMPSPTTAARVDRRSALQVPAVKRARDLIAGAIGGLPLDTYGPGQTATVNPLFVQPEAGIARSVTLTRTVEDLLFEGIAWWRVTETGWHTYPTRVRRLDVNTVTVRDGQVYVDGKPVSDSELIRFDSPNDPLLVVGARAIRTCLALDAAAARYADGAPPLDYFTPAEGMDPADDADVTSILDAWHTARQTRATGYVPAALKYNIAGWSPEQLQLADARQHAVLEIARLTGVDPEELGVSTTSRTYANMFDRRKQLTDFTLGGYMRAVEERLSMGDVTARGHVAAFNLDAFLRSDPKGRFEAYKVGLDVGALTREEVRAMENRPPITDTPEVADVAAAVVPTQTFDAAPVIRLDSPTATAFEVDAERRTIRGLLVPYGTPARSNGKLWQFSKGTLTYASVSRVKLWIQHDPDRAVGVATELDDREDGLYGAFKVARGPAGDLALSMAEDGVLDGFSVGLGQGGQFVVRDGINHAVSAPLMETSLTPAPSFDDARVHAVAASAAHQEGNAVMPEEIPTVVTEPSAPDFSAITAAIATGFAGLGRPAEGREVIPAGREVAQVSEPSPYRFDGAEGAQSFSEDLRTYNSNPDARQRLERFMEDAFAGFAVTSTGTAALNPTQNRPDLYVPNMTYSRPLWDLVTTGTLTDKTPFSIPRFASASGLVGAHTEGVEPTPGSFTATSQTVTPGAVSGKVEIVREVWDQGGSPQADQIIWAEMVNGYFEALEAKVAAVLNGLTLTEINLAGAVDEALVDAIQNVFVDLQYVRGGNRYTALALDGVLFKALVNASDTSGRKLLPIVGPSNAQGSTDGGFSAVAVGAQTGRAAWALGATNASNSYLFVPSSVYAWASAPKQFTFEYRVSAVDLAIWGYSAAAVTRDTDVKRIDYTTADV